MATSVTLNGVSYSIPAVSEGAWGTNVSNYLIALATGVLSKSGGSFTLTADANFGANYGLLAAYFSSRSTPATAGIFRLGNAEYIYWRNAANDGNLGLRVNSSDLLEFNGNPLLTLALGTANYVLKMNSGGTAYEWGLLANANIDASAAIAYSKLALTGSILNADINASAAIAYSKLALTGAILNADINASAAIAYSKLALTDSILNADINSSAAIAYSKLALTGAILNADINASAAIALSKLAATTASRALVSDGSGFVSAATTTATEIGYVNGVTSAIQTQIDSKAAHTSGTITTPTIATSAKLANAAELQFEDDDEANTWSLKAPTTLSGSTTLTLPNGAGSANQVLTTNGTDTLSWSTVAAGIGTNYDTNTVTDANYVILDDDGYKNILVDPGASARTITLPTAADNTDRTIVVVKSTADAGTVTLTSESSELASDIVLTSLNDSAVVVCDGTNWFPRYYRLATDSQAGIVTLPSSHVFVSGGNGYGSTNTKIRRFTSTITSTGSAITYADSATLGNSFTINEDGVYAITYHDRHNASAFQSGISLNSGQLTTNVASINVNNILSYDNPAAATIAKNSVTLPLSAGDVVRAHDNGINDQTSALVVNFRIAQVYKF